MSSSKKTSSPAAASGRSFKLLHQALSISDVNFRKKIITGSTELSLLPLTANGKIWKLPLNCKQCRILRVSVNGRKANFTYIDPTLCICSPDTKKRSLEYYNTCRSEAVKSCDSDCSSSAGELNVKVPRDTYDALGRTELPMKLQIDFSLEQPKGGVQFVIPSSSGQSPESSAFTHVFTYGWENSSRLWFPCVDSCTELCRWNISLCVPSSMMGISCGDLTEQVISSDGRKRYFYYSLNTPTPAPQIAFVIGSFEVYPDPVMQEVTHFCLKGLLPLLKNTVQFVHEVFGFYEELLSSRFPHSNYKMVYVDESYQDSSNYSTLTILNTNLLHSRRVIDLVMSTRKVIAYSIAKQYFGCYLQPQSINDWWLPVGMAGFVAGLFTKKMFGSTEYQYWIMQEHQKVCKYEMDHHLPPLCGSISSLSLPSTTASSSRSGSPPSPTLTSSHPDLLSDREKTVLATKAHLVLRMIQQKIGHDLFLQVFNKLLTLASGAGQSLEYLLWQSMFVSTSGFLNLLLTVSGKDLSHFLEQWVCRSGVACFHSSFTYVRKKNMVELQMSQDSKHGYSKFVGPMTVVVQEFDGFFTHNIQIEENTSTYEIPCHSKIRKAKKRKMPLSHGEEIEIGVSGLDMEVPVMWVRPDPEMQWIRQISMQQADTVWMNTLTYNRDAVSQLEAIEALGDFPSSAVQSALQDAVLNNSFYHHVRIAAAHSLSKVLTSVVSEGNGGSLGHLVQVFRQLFCVQAYPHLNLVCQNDFSDPAAYFIQQELPKCAASVRNKHGQCPREILSFLLDLLKYNDNSTNKFSDGYYQASLIDALANSVSPIVSVMQPAGTEFSKNPLATLQSDIQTVLQEIVQSLNIEKVLPSHQYKITASCIKALRVLQKMGHLPSDSSVFKEYARSDQFIGVRMTALEIIVDIVENEQKQEELNFLLDVVETDLPCVRLAVLNMLSDHPPFHKTDTALNTLPLVERLWKLICTKFSADSKLRNAAVELYTSLYGRITPSCVPQGLAIVIDLKEKVARSSLVSPVVSPKPAATKQVSPVPASLLLTSASEWCENPPSALYSATDMESEDHTHKSKKQKRDKDEHKKKHKHKQHKHKHRH